LAATLPEGRIGDVIRYQLVKAGTSVGVNYREANRAESRNDFIHKIGTCRKGGFGKSILAGNLRRSKVW
jgi:four helix bundle protein